MDYTSAITTAKPLEGSVVDLVQGQADYELRKRQLDDAQKVATEQKIASERKQRADSVKALKDEFKLGNITPTGVKTWDALGIGVSSEIIEPYVELIERSKDPNLTQEELANIKVGLTKLTNIPSLLNTAAKSYEELKKNYYEGIAKEPGKGGILRDLKLESFLEGGLDGYRHFITKDYELAFAVKPTVNEYGFPTNSANQDVNGDGKIDEFDVYKLDSLLNKQDSFGFTKAFSRDNDITELSKLVGKETFIRNDGTTETVNTKVDKNSELAKIQNLFLDRTTGVPTERATSYAKQAGINDLDSTMAQKMAYDMYKDVMSSYDKTNSSEQVSSNLQVRKQNFDENKDKEPIIDFTKINKTTEISKKELGKYEGEEHFKGKGLEGGTIYNLGNQDIRRVIGNPKNGINENLLSLMLNSEGRLAIETKIVDGGKIDSKSQSKDAEGNDIESTKKGALSMKRKIYTSYGNGAQSREIMDITKGVTNPYAKKKGDKFKNIAEIEYAVKKATGWKPSEDTEETTNNASKTYAGIDPKTGKPIYK